MTTRCAEVDSATMIVRNVIVADPNSFELPDALIVATDTAEVGWTWDGSVFAAPPAPTPDISELRAAAILRVDSEAETCRLLYVTPGAAQSAVYLRKADEGARYSAVGDAGEPYPLLDASIGIEANDRSGVAAIVNATATVWMAVAAAIEALRLGAKKSIGEAATGAEIDAVFPIAWPAP